MQKTWAEGWVDGELWHGTWEGDASDIRRIGPRSGEGLETIDMPAGGGVSGLDSAGVPSVGSAAEME